MTTASTELSPSEQATAYCAEVAQHLGVLGEEERADLIEDLVAHLTDVATEEDGSLVERLGSPAAYAAELLAAEGHDGDAATKPHIALRDRLSRSTLGRGLRWLRGSRAGRTFYEIEPVLISAWLVARGYFAVCLIAAISLGNRYPGLPIPRLFGSPILGALAILVAVPASIRWQPRAVSGRRRWATLAIDAVSVVFALATLNSAARVHIQYVGASTSATVGPPCLSDASGQATTNLYPHDAQGNLLSDVLLYDQNGRPVGNLCADVDAKGRELHAEYRHDVNNAAVANVFPRRQQTLDTGETAPDGSAGTPVETDVNPPAVVVPKLAPVVSPGTTVPTTPAAPTTTAPPAAPVTRPTVPAPTGG